MESVAATHLVGQRLLYKSSFNRNSTCCHAKQMVYPETSVHRFLASDFFGRRILHPQFRRQLTMSSTGRQHQMLGSDVRARAIGLTKEAYELGEERVPRTLPEVGRKLWPPPNKADDTSLANPLLRQERMGCGWFGVIFELEGVVIEEMAELENRSWLVLAEEEGQDEPPTFMLKRIEGMKNEQAISEILCWSRDPCELKRMGLRREAIYQKLHGGFYSVCTGSREFLSNLKFHGIPMALVSTRPRSYLETTIGAIGLEIFFNVVVAGDDVHRGKPDPEMFLYAAQLLNLIPERCIVFGNSNSTVEAAQDARMKCIAVAGKHPKYELGAANLVIMELDELSIVDLKNLADIETVFDYEEGEPDMEMELEDDAMPSTSLWMDD